MLSKKDIVIKAMEIDQETGTSKWFEVETLEKQVGFSLRGNGSPYFQNDRGLGTTYAIQKQMKNGALQSVRTTGFATYHQSNRASVIPSEVKKWLTGHPCSMCGTSSRVCIDHKDGNKEPIEITKLEDFQPLCVHCNDVKRETCKKCNKSSNRFDAKALGYNISWTIGDRNFQPKDPRCKGCFWYDPKAFRKMLSIKEHIK